MTSTRVPLSVLDLAPVSAGSTGAQALRDAVTRAQRVDALGYHRIWFAEHHLAPGVASSAPAPLAAIVAERTVRIRVGSGAVLLASTSPLLAAEQFGTLAALHPGRIDLGLGRAWAPPAPASDGPAGAAPSAAASDGPASRGSASRRGPREVAGLLVPADPPRAAQADGLDRLRAQQRIIGAARSGSSLRSELELVLALRAGALLDDGTTYVSPAVAGADFELWVLASSGGESARAAGELGLPLAANYHVSPSTVLDTVASYRAAFRPGVLDRPYVLVSADVLVADTDAQARRIGQPYGQWVHSIRAGSGAIPYPAPGADALGWDDDARALVEDRVSTRFVGSPETVVRGLEALQRATGADEIVVTTIAHDPADTLRSFEHLAEAWFTPVETDQWGPTDRSRVAGFTAAAAGQIAVWSPIR